MEFVGGSGLSLFFLAIQSFPSGFKVTQFADDADPISFDPTEPVAFDKLIDGSLFFYQTTAPITVNISVIPGSNDDENLKILLQAKKGRVSVIPLQDNTSMAVDFPGLGPMVFSNGSIISGPVSDSVITSGRKKANTYKFVFGNYSGFGTVKQAASTIANAIGSLI